MVKVVVLPTYCTPAARDCTAENVMDYLCRYIAVLTQLEHLSDLQTIDPRVIIERTYVMCCANRQLR